MESELFEEGAKIIKERVIEAYTMDNIEAKIYPQEIFNGGYWKNIDLTKELQAEDKVKASYDSYRFAFQSIELNQNDKLLEIGCSSGHGLIDALKTYRPKILKGIDITPFAIEKANRIHKDLLEENKNLSFEVGSAEDIPSPDNAFTKAFMIETANHIPDIRKLCQEVFRVLEPRGKIGIMGHLPKDLDSAKHVKLVWWCKGGITNLTSVEVVREEMKKAGMVELVVDNISEDVFPGLLKWSQTMKDEGNFPASLLKAHRDGFLNYYIQLYEKP